MTKEQLKNIRKSLYVGQKPGEHAAFMDVAKKTPNLYNGRFGTLVYINDNIKIIDASIADKKKGTSNVNEIKIIE